MARSRSIDTTDAQRQRIMDAAEVVIRRHGPGKTNVVDVARELGQSHASVYRYFASKAELFDALVERWVARVSEPLEAIARGEGPAGDRLREWLMALFRAKVRKVTADPELFSTYHAIAAESPEAVARHRAMLDEHVAAIVADGVAAGEFPPDTDPRRAARAILSGSLRFHHPTLLAQAPGPPTEQEAEDVFALLVTGLKSGVG
jgi:AcrR family transcriptional regulator